MTAMNEFPSAPAPALLQRLADTGVRDVAIVVCDLAGQLRGKWLSREKFAAACATGCPFPPIFPVTDFCDVVLPVAAGATLARLGDGSARVAADTQRALPWRKEPAALFFAGMTGAEADLDPRVLYGRVLESARALGVVPWQALEYEFTLLDAQRHTLAAHGYRDLQPAGTQSALYGVWRMLATGDYWPELRAALETAGIPVEAMHAEFGAGTQEVILAPAPGLRAADNAVLLRELVKAHAARQGMLATFMARWSGTAPGNSGHVHISLSDCDGRPMFAADASGWNACARHFIGGLQRFLPELLLVLMPNVNSLRRLAPAAWSFDGRWCLWGEDNRTTAIRVLRDGAGSGHVEVRIPGADANPYLVLAAVLGAGLRGITAAMEPSAPLPGNAFASTREWPQALRLPRTFVEAMDRFGESAFAAELFGQEFQRVFVQTRRAQELESRDAVSEWELRRFLE